MSKKRPRIPGMHHGPPKKKHPLPGMGKTEAEDFEYGMQTLYAYVYTVELAGGIPSSITEHGRHTLDAWITANPEKAAEIRADVEADHENLLAALKEGR